jgi:hypothetical protein
MADQTGAAESSHSARGRYHAEWGNLHAVSINLQHLSLALMRPATGRRLLHKFEFVTSCKSDWNRAVSKLQYKDVFRGHVTDGFREFTSRHDFHFIAEFNALMFTQ